LSELSVDYTPCLLIAPPILSFKEALSLQKALVAKRRYKLYYRAKLIIRPVGGKVFGLRF